MALYKVIDNYLPETVHKNMHDYCVYSENDMWSFLPIQTSANEIGKERPQFIIPIQNDLVGLTDPHNVWKPLLDNLDAMAFLRIKLNCTLNTHTPEPSQYHTDFPGKIVMMTAIYYINTNNGYTQFEHDDSKVNSVANRIVLFPSSLRHRAVTTTDTPYRMVMNLNYHPKPLS